MIPTIVYSVKMPVGTIILVLRDKFNLIGILVIVEFIYRGTEADSKIFIGAKIS